MIGAHEWPLAATAAVRRGRPHAAGASAAARDVRHLLRRPAQGLE